MRLMNLQFLSLLLKSYQPRINCHSFQFTDGIGIKEAKATNKILCFCKRIRKENCRVMEMNPTFGSFETNPTDWMNAEHSTGTSIMAVEFEGGVVIGADSRTTLGAYIGNCVSDKLYKVTDHIYCCRSGSAADTQAVSDAVAYHLGLLERELGEPVGVKVAANDFRQLCYSYRDSLSAGIIIGGWDRKNGGQVYSIPLGGMLSREKCCIGGSGSSYIYGFIDEHYRPNMTKEECIEFVAKGLGHAMWRDGSSGGVIRICAITEKGAERKVFVGDQVPQYYPK